MRVWRIHAKDPSKHDAVIEACTASMNRTATLGEYLPAVKTLMAWHLLAGGKQQRAAEMFEGALLSAEASKTAPAIARSADTLARRWLTRIDHLAVEKAIRAYYIDNVAFPSSLAQLQSQPSPPPKADRFGDAWVYSSAGLSKIKNAASQRFSLHSRSLGNRLTAMTALPFTAYGKKQASIAGKRQGTPVMVDFETVTDAGTLRGTASEGSAVNGIRFLKLSSDAQFAVMIESEGDFWIVATTGGR